MVTAPSGTIRVPMAPGAPQAAVPAYKPYLAVLWVGVGNVMFELDVSSEISAAFAGYFLATRHYPRVHTVAVWRRIGPDPKQVQDPPVLYLVLNSLDKECSPAIEKLTGQAPAPPSGVTPGGQAATPGAIPLSTPEQGFEEMAKQVKDAQGKRGGTA